MDQEGKYRGRKVLPDEEYLGKMDEIIERDYFPNLEKLRQQERYLDAVSVGDISTAQRIQEECTPDESKTGGNSLGLDEYMARYTNEEDVSCELLLQKDHEEHKKKYSWAYSDSGKPIPLSIEASAAPETLALDDPKTLLLKGQASNTRKKHSGKMEPPASNINRSATRFLKESERKRVGVKKRETGQIGEGKTHKQYDTLKTPLITPESEEPIMTWGELDGTPLVLAIDKDASAYRMPSVRSRELSANRLTESSKTNSSTTSTPLRNKLLQSAGLTPTPRAGSTSRALAIIARRTPAMSVFTKRSASRTPKRTQPTPQSTKRRKPVNTEGLLDI